MRPLLQGMVIAAALSFVACGGGDVEEFIKMDTEKAEAFAAGGDDCAAKAKSVGEWRKANSARYKEMRKKLAEQYKDGPPEKYKDQFKKNSKAVVGAMMKCSNDPAFSKMMDETKAK